MSPEEAEKLSLAPLRGITNATYREVFSKHFGGLDCAMAPFIPEVNARHINPKLLEDISPRRNSKIALIPQIIGNRPENLLRMADAIAQLGYQEINWNLGCPMRQIRNKMRGAGLLPHPDIIDRVLAQLSESNAPRISVKVRLGVARRDQLLKLVPLLNEYPLSEVIVHPRTAREIYSGSADLDAFEQILHESVHPVCYNGDITTLNFFRALKKRFPDLERFMLGRGLIANPFLAEIIRSNGREIPDSRRRLSAFHDELFDRYRAQAKNETVLLGKMKGLWSYLSRAIVDGESIFNEIKICRELANYQKIVARQLKSIRFRFAQTSRES